MKNTDWQTLKTEVLELAKGRKKNRGADKQNHAYTKAAEGNPKLEGPNRPST